MKKLFVTLLITGLQCIGIQYARATLSVTASVIQNVSCHGGSNGITNCSPSGGTAPYTFLWSPGSQSSPVASGLSAATYTITVTDNSGNTASAAATVTQPSAVTITASAQHSAVCPGSSDSLFASGSGGTIPYTYSWAPAPFGDVSCNTCQNTNVYPYGAAYMVTAIVDAMGCTATASVSVTVYPFPYVTISGPINPIAPGRSDTLNALAVGATSYLWNNSATTTTIIVSPSVSTTYSVKATNMFGCYDTAHYTIDTNSIGNGNTSSTAIRIVPGTNLNTASFSTLDSVVWFSFIPTDSNNQIIANSAFLGMPVPHVHRLTLYNSSLGMIVDEPMPDIVGANQIRIDISHLHPGSTYYVRAARCPAHANMAGCNPSSGGECNSSQRWDFQMCFRTVPVFVPDDSGSEAPATNQLYYECRGQIEDLNSIPRFDLKAYTNFSASPIVYASDSALSFVYGHVDTSTSFTDTIQRVDMVLTGASLQPSQPVFKMEEDSNAGYLNYFKEFIANGMSNVEGYARLVYKNVYPNVDMQVYSNVDGTKLYFVCNPGSGGGSGGNPANIELQFKGASSMGVTGGGGLNVVTELGTLSFAPGYAYTDSAGIIKPKSWQPYFVTVNSNTVKFNVGSYNTAEPLIIRIDQGHAPMPSLSSSSNLKWSTYMGGQTGFNDAYTSVCTDASDYIYAAGYSESPTFPVSLNRNIVQTQLKGGIDAVVAKFNSSTVLDWATYYGGSQNDEAKAITVDASGDVFFTGYTYSTDFPEIHPPLLTYPNCFYSGVLNNGNPTSGQSDAFIVMLNSNGNFKTQGNYTPWATYYGGEDVGPTKCGEVGNGIALDGSHNLYIVGGHLEGITSPGLPLVTETGGYNSSNGAAFALKFNVDLSSPTNFGKCLWATDAGGTYSSTSPTTFNGCTVDISNNLLVVGTIYETGYPNIGGRYGWASGARCNAIVTKFNVINNSMDWATYFGGYFTFGNAIATLDGAVYITGMDYYASGYNLQVLTPGPGPYYQSTNPQSPDPSSSSSYLATFDGGGTSHYATYYGQGYLHDEQEFGTTIDASGAGHGLIVVAGYSNEYYTPNNNEVPFPSPNAPNTYVQNYAGGLDDGFIGTFSTNAQYFWATDFGGTGAITPNNNGQDYIYGSCVDANNNTLYIVGQTTTQTNNNFPLQNAGGYYQPSNNDARTGFIASFDLTPVETFAGLNSLSFSNDVSLYPNPTNNNVTVSMNLAEKGNVEFTLYNVMGQVISDNITSYEGGSINHEISLSLLSDGIYFLKITTDKSVSTKKVVKEN